MTDRDELTERLAYSKEDISIQWRAIANGDDQSQCMAFKELSLSSPISCVFSTPGFIPMTSQRRIKVTQWFKASLPWLLLVYMLAPLVCYALYGYVMTTERQPFAGIYDHGVIAAISGTVYVIAAVPIWSFLRARW